MPEPQPGARPADGSTPGAEPDRDPAAANEPTSPAVPSDQPEPSAQPETPDQPQPSAQPESPAQPETPDQPQPSGQPEAATAEAPAPRWSGSAPVPPPLPRRPAWGESVEPTPPPPVPVGPPEHQTPVDPWAGVDTGGWDLPSAELPPLPPTAPYPTPPATRQWSGPPAPPVGSHPVSPAAAPRPPQATGPRIPTRPMSPPALPPAPPKQRRGRRSTTPPMAPPPGWQAPKGYVPVPVRRRRRWPWLLLLTLACCCGCPAYYGFPISAQYPVQAALPAQVDDLSLRQDNRSAETAQQLENEVRKEHWLAEDTFAGIYSTSNGKQVTVFGGTGFRLNPESDAEAEISRLTERYALDAPESVDTGVRGRHERCAVGRSGGGDVVVCTSVDYGSIATGVFTRLSVGDSAALLATLRAQIVQPKG
ncbi:hypothetical protein [Micromonospora parathelypteridis]|uniref:Uncharacterized protein n=1 Tax=Micromonospora parathelypteridis TaxID=1839617 RepID=A0A840VM80_9ACTN|nr:hypothetical protein [Micromonospora parathelypteridis]MBB5477036.1 hypothetical protein [Micromonospora parathelypteridis]GGO18207.1 hypothetical protein GCM10011576_32970 [Micromonospora parathelypteridis]